MNVYLIRHADALSVGDAGVKRDADRPLSPDGVRQLETLAPVLVRLGFKPRVFATSPLVRAVQTAEALVKHGRLAETAVVTCDELAPGGSSKKLVKFLRQHGGGDIALSGHAPDIGEHTAYLIGDKAANVHFSKGAVACVELEDEPAKGGGALCWLISGDLCGEAGK